MKPDVFYVGYLPLPAPMRRPLTLFVVLALVAIVGIAGSFAAAQRSPGDGVWETATERTWGGTLFADPYPMLLDGDGKVWLVTEMGKRGAMSRAKPLDGSVVMLRGFQLQREGRVMIELAPEDSAIVSAQDRSHDRPTLSTTSRTTLRGEILDGKCYLGAMKPGDGMAHRACAALCIQGGIPPMLYAPAGETRTPVVLLTSDGASARDLVLPFLGEPVQITGIQGSLGSLPVLLIDAGSIRRD